MESNPLKTVVLGGGISGLGAARLLKSENQSVILVDRKPELPKDLEDISCLSDSEDLARIYLEPDKIREIIKSPGISPSHPWLVLARERGIGIRSELDLARGFYSGKLVGITGTDGKSTTTQLTHHLLLLDFPKSSVGGNIGKAFSEICKMDLDLIILECSSYQLEDSDQLDFDAAAILNLAPDHLERHGNMENYAQAKFRIVNTEKRDHVWITQDQVLPFLKINPNDLQCKTLLFGESSGSSAWIKPDIAMIQTKNSKYNTEKFRLPGFHNLQNLAAAILLAESVGGTPENIQTQIENFQGLAHRFEVFLESHAWTFINDSKSTNLHSLLAWLSNFQLESGNLHLLLGGRPKEESLKPLLEKLSDLPAQIYLFGEARVLWKKEFQFLGEKVHYLETMEEALIRIRSIWTKVPEYKSWVVLSPGCASFDQFKNFEDRGNQFKGLVKALFAGPE
jgi:UDP-N-acetylmuramoylalanine--D-glutamate ligase